MMQLPPSEEVVLVSGSPPVRAEKARYYADPQFKVRIGSPPDLANSDESTAEQGASDDWSRRLPIKAPTPPKRKKGEDETDGGIRREPYLPEHEDIAPEPAPARSEFADLDDEPGDDGQRAKAMRDKFGTVARQASLDPDDGIEL
jgi:type IV secretion system protein VirD4